MLGKSATAVDSTYCIDKAILCTGSNGIDHISEDILNSLDGQIKMSVDLIPYRLFAKIHFSVEFQVMYTHWHYMYPTGHLEI
jgi:hypothetical protein